MSLADATIKRLASVDPLPEPPIVPVKHPIMLMHGFGIFASFRRGGHLHRQAMHLRKHGIQAYAPNVPPYDRIPERAKLWKAYLEHILEETGASSVNLVAHSMGGLDARYLISNLGMHEHISTLITISTPHRGTSIASYFLEQPEKIRLWFSDLADWMGTTALPNGKSDFLNAVTDLTPENVCNSFNPETPDHPSVRYWSFAGQAGAGTDVPINPLLGFLNKVLYEREGINDGYVSVESAQWGEFQGTVDGDHVAQIGIVTIMGIDLVANDFYLSIARMLNEEGY